MAQRKRSAPRRRALPRQRGVVRQRPFARIQDLIDAWRMRRAEEFRPDSETTAFIKLLHVTPQQRLTLIRWTLYVLMVILAITLQDVIFSRITLMHACLDLPATVILLLTILEGSEVGSLFVLLASIFYYFSGSAPGAYSVGFLSIFGTVASLLRQTYWHRSSGSIVLCTGIAILMYEIGLFGAGLFLELTSFRYFMRFIMTALYSAVMVIPLYPLCYRIGLIGGNTWKE